MKEIKFDMMNCSYKNGDWVYCNGDCNNCPIKQEVQNER